MRVPCLTWMAMGTNKPGGRFSTCTYKTAVLFQLAQGLKPAIPLDILPVRAAAPLVPTSISHVNSTVSGYWPAECWPLTSKAGLSNAAQTPTTARWSGMTVPFEPAPVRISPRLPHPALNNPFSPLISYLKSWDFCFLNHDFSLDFSGLGHHRHG